MVKVWDLWTFLVALLLPRSAAKNWLLSLRPGHQVDPGAMIGHCVVRGVGQLRIERGVEIGLLTVFWGLRRVDLGENAFLGQMNWISATSDFPEDTGDDPHAGVFEMARESLMTNRHRLDCSGGLYFDEFASLAGYGVNVLTHSYSLQDTQQHKAMTRLGRNSFIATRSLLLMGASTAEGVVIAAGSVVAAPLTQERGFYAGTPAQCKREMPADLAFYHRAHRPGVVET